jgi:hypothetical protein
VTQIADNNPEKDLKLFRELIKFDLCSVKDLKELKRIGLFDDKELYEILEKKYEELAENNEGLK